MQSRTLARTPFRDLRRVCWSGSRVSHLGRPPWAAWAGLRAGTSVSEQSKMLSCMHFNSIVPQLWLLLNQGV